MPLRRRLLAEARGFGSCSLAEWLEALAMEPAEFYGVRGAGFTSLRRALGWLPGDPHPLAEGFCEAVEESLSRATASTRCPGPCRFRCACTAATAAPRSKRRLASCVTTPPGSTAKACSVTNPIHTNLLFVTLNKSESLFSPTTRTRDLALGP